jgi:hypothetical protein
MQWDHNNQAKGTFSKGIWEATANVRHGLSARLDVFWESGAKASVKIDGLDLSGINAVLQAAIDSLNE